MRSPRSTSLLRVACSLTLVSLVLIGMAIVYPWPLAVMAAMSLGQAIGTVGFVIFAAVVLRDLGPAIRGRSESTPPRRDESD